MQTWIALFRGLNVGGHNVLPMSQLRADMEAIGLKEVRTYIQSGNVVFASPSQRAALLANKITRQIQNCATSKSGGWGWRLDRGG